MSKDKETKTEQAASSVVETVVIGTVNEKIAQALGFKKYTYKVNGRDVEAWEYPEEYKHLVVGSPEHNLPDFKSMIDDAIEFVNRNHIRREYQ